MTIDPLEHAIADGAIRALDKRAALLRQTAKQRSTIIEFAGRSVVVNDPEATTALRTADVFAECAADLRREYRR